MIPNISRALRRSLGLLAAAALLAACATPSTPTGPTPPPRPPASKAPADVVSDAGERDDSLQPAERPVAGNDIYFAFGASVIDAAGKDKLRALAERLKANPRDEVLLLGSTDYLGSRAYNMAIAEQRVSEVARLLRSFGVAVRQIKSKIAGSSLIEAACKTAACRQQMRRVQVVYNPAQK